MTKDQFEKVFYPQYEANIAAIARRLASADYDLFADLCQEGAIALWRCNPEKATRSQSTYINQAIKYRMIDYLRKQARATHVSLDQLDDVGIQIMDTSDGPRLVVLRQALVELYHEDFEDKANG